MRWVRIHRYRLEKFVSISNIILINLITLINAFQIDNALASPTLTLPYVPSHLSKVVIDGKIERDEYGGSYLELYPALPAIHWEHDGVIMRVGLVSPGAGWVSIGFGKKGIGMHGANIIIGYVDSEGSFHIRDHFGIGVNHTSDVSLGGKDDIIFAAGSEVDGKTIIEFIFPLNSGDVYDHSFEVGGLYGFIIAFSKFSDDFTSFHGSARSGTLDLFIEPMPTVIPTILSINLPERVSGNESLKIIAILKDKNGTPIERAFIDFYMRTSIGWLKLGSNMTNSDGVATLNFTPMYADVIN
ncbi:MAG: DOMON domain-containing protein, partial [Nitrososphaerota archaeon]|nr:DOMON domain-containing protein [Nitrososphaerota archaeon]